MSRDQKAEIGTQHRRAARASIAKATIADYVLLMKEAPALRERLV
jgi:hypothetical protein